MTRQRPQPSAHDQRHLSRRERQIMDVLLACGEASAADVRARIPDPPSYSAVRALLAKLLEKGHAAYRQDGQRYLYRPTVDRSRAQRHAWQRLVDTFFASSTTEAMVSLLGREGDSLSDDELDRIDHAISQIKARKRRRRSRGRP